MKKYLIITAFVLSFGLECLAPVYSAATPTKSTDHVQIKLGKQSSIRIPLGRKDVQPQTDKKIIKAVNPQQISYRIR